METGKSAGIKFNGAGTKHRDSVRMVQDKSRKRRRKIGSIDIDASGDDNGSRIVEQTEAKCTYCDRTFKSFQAMGGHMRVHYYNSEMMEESAGADTKLEGKNDADITGSKIEVARMEWTSDEHNRKDGTISGSDDINELDLNKSPKYVSDRENSAKRVPDSTTAGKGRKKREINSCSSEDKRRKRRKTESINIDASGVDNGSRFVKQTEAKCTYCDRTFKSFQAMGGHKRVHHHNKPKENREMMEESAGAETNPEGENDADITGSKIEFAARMECSSDKHNKKDGRISGSDDINELDLNKSPKTVSVRENGEKRAPDATTAGKGRKERERSKFDFNRSPN